MFFLGHNDDQSRWSLLLQTLIFLHQTDTPTEYQLPFIKKNTPLNGIMFLHKSSKKNVVNVSKQWLQL